MADRLLPREVKALRARLQGRIRFTKEELGEMADQCGATASMCTCSLPKGHEGAHHCMDENAKGVCDGQWLGEIDTDSFRIVKFPGADRMNPETLASLEAVVRSIRATLDD